MNCLPRTERAGRPLAIAEGLLVTIIWGSSFVFVKVGLRCMGPLTIAGLRYFIAFLVLLPLVAVRRRSSTSVPLPSRVWLRLLLIGLSAYVVGNGALFWGLKYLSATAGSFLMSLIPLPVLLLSSSWLREVPTPRQTVGGLIALAGSCVFFSPGLSSGEPLGIGITAVALIGFASFAILGREIARDRQVKTLTLTAIPLGFGGGLLLLIALLVEGVPGLPAAGWGLVVWLAIVNTALGYLLYNHSLQVLNALEMNVLLNLTPLATALLAWVFLGEKLAIAEIVGMVVVIAGVLAVQWRDRGPLRPGGCEVETTGG
ncbi:MAG: EamA family transporter [Anaerolineae bacterium]|jgi:drug/metabolite transporter (DMT)-like permease